MIIENVTDNNITKVFDLWLQAGWNSTYKINIDDFRKSWSRSIVKKCIVEDKNIVAIGRANGDGVLYSMIHDIVVDQNKRRMGYGRLIVGTLIGELMEMKIRSIQLISAKNQAEFYVKLGFSVRTNDNPGMQYDFKL